MRRTNGLEQGPVVLVKLQKTNFVKNEQMANLRITLQIFLAATFLFSAYTKAVAPGFFEVLLEQQS